MNLSEKEKWQQIFYDALDRASIENLRDDYKYVGLKDIGTISHSETPLPWFRILAVQFLLDLHAKWKEQANKLEEEYYLKIWLFEKYFYDSQVVFAVKKLIAGYVNLFDAAPVNKQIPLEFSDLLSQFSIEYKKYTGDYYLEDLDGVSTKLVIENSNLPISEKIYTDIDVNKSVKANLSYLMDNGLVEEKHVSVHPNPVYKIQIDGVWVIDLEKSS